MVTEIAQIDVNNGSESNFEKAVAEATPLIRRARGCHGVRLWRSVERPNRYRLLVDWENVEQHTDFRATADFARWRELAGPYFAAPPEVEHILDVTPTQ
jgi:quinol monooxygenase YgiN